MSTMGTFDAFTSARLGIYAAQHGFRVTGNNISNINTEGYTRQRLDQVSFKAGAYDRYRSELDNHVGSGALVMNINQVRDPYLDVRYRNTAADVGYNDTMLDGLNHLAAILDEVGVGDDTNVNKKGDGRLQAQIQAVSDALRKFAKEPTSANNILVRNAASSLCSILNSYATKLEDYRKETEEDFVDKITEINEHLTNIRDLNDEIRDNEIFGDNALELRDERNREIDALSKLIHIKVVYSEENVGSGKKVEKLSIYLDNDNPDPNQHKDESLLVDGIFGSQFYWRQVPTPNPDYDPNDAASLPYLDADGNPCEEADAAMMNSPNYDISITKLVDENGKEWSSTSPTYRQLTTDELKAFGMVPGEKATYSYGVTAGGTWNDGDTIDVGPGNATITIGANGDISVADMNDPAKLAAVIASKLNGSVDGYTVTADNGNLVYTANKTGKVGSQGPAAAPNGPTFTPGGTGGTITFGTPTVNDGVDYVAPTFPDDTTTPNTTPENSETMVGYRQSNGVWYEVTSLIQKTAEVDLHDNDLYGSLQATRELLTEAGAFTTEDVVKNIDPDAASKRGIPYYQYSLDLFARRFAEEYNKLNDLGEYTDNGVKYGKFVDQDGNPIPLDAIKDGKYTYTKEVPTIKVGADGTVSFINEDTGEYEPKEGWTLDSGTGFCVKDGHFVGVHEDGNGTCVITDKIPVPTSDPDNIADVYQGLVDSGFTDNTITPPATAADKDKVMALLTTCLNEHGVKPADITEITVTVDVPKPGVLFSNRNDGDKTDDPPINASNISISQSWINDSVQLVPKFEILWDGDLEHSTQNTNADHMVTLIDPSNIVEFNPKDIVPDAISDKLFSGSFNGMYNNICTVLGEDQKRANVALNMHYTQLVEIDTSRDGVSGVDLNDEAMNLMQFQKAYTAACRLMTVVDEALDRLINNTAV